MNDTRDKAVVGDTQPETCMCAYSGGYKGRIQNATTHIAC